MSKRAFRIKNVVVAVVHDADKRFFVSFNRRWSQYTFPMTGADEIGADLAQLALKALRDHCPYPVKNAVATELEYAGGFGPSWGTEQDTFYNYHVYEIYIDARMWPAGRLGSWCGFLDYGQLLEPLPVSPAGLVIRPDPEQAGLISWSTRFIAKSLMDGQEVALAVICRSTPAGKEFLLVQNAGYGGYFFPVARKKTEASITEVVIEAVQSDTRYLGKLLPEFVTEVETEHESRRYTRKRKYQFFICSMELPDCDLNAPDNEFEKTLVKNKIEYRWINEEQLRDEVANGLSPTVKEVRAAAVKACKCDPIKEKE